MKHIFSLIKINLILNVVESFTQEGVEFSDKFEENKRILKGMSVSKKIRNQLAGLLTRNRKNKEKQAL